MTKIDMNNYREIQKLLKFKPVKGKFVARFVSVNSNFLSMDFFMIFTDELDFIGFTSKIDNNYALSIPHKGKALVVFE